MKRRYKHWTRCSCRKRSGGWPRCKCVNRGQCRGGRCRRNQSGFFRRFGLGTVGWVTVKSDFIHTQRERPTIFKFETNSCHVASIGMFVFTIPHLGRFEIHVLKGNLKQSPNTLERNDIKRIAVRIRRTKKVKPITVAVAFYPKLNSSKAMNLSLIHI